MFFFPMYMCVIFEREDLNTVIPGTESCMLPDPNVLLHWVFAARKKAILSLCQALSISR